MDQIIENDAFKFLFDLSNGTWNVESKIIPRTVIKNGFCSIKLGKKEVNSLGNSCQFFSGPFEGMLGKGTRYRLDCEAAAEDLRFTFQLYITKFDDKHYMTLEFVVRNNNAIDVDVNHISPLTVKASQEGGIYIGSDPSNAIIFENGFSVQEFLMRSFNATEESDSMWMEFIYSKPDLKENILLGSIDKSDNVCEVITNDEESKGFVYEDREGVAEYQARKYFPFPKPFSPGDTLTSGIWVLTIDNPSGFDALEEYADLIRINNNIRVWPYEVPHGWNSWNNPLDSVKEYSYAQDITEDIILRNMNMAVAQLKRFGLSFWNVDDGYMNNHILNIDDVDLNRFPNGMKYIADQMHAQGLKAGLWINPFNVGKESKLWTEHQHDNWFPDPDPSFPIKNRWRPLDLSVPEVQDYLRHYIRKVVKEWGFDVLKCDFTYHAMSPRKFFKKDMTGPEALRLGYKIIREEAGPNILIYGIGGPIGLHWGDVDGERLTLDTLPRWGEESNMGVAVSGVLPSYHCLARRYFLNNRIWFNHMDLLCFRPSLQNNEIMMLANAMALLGGLFKLGDKMENLSPENFGVLQKMLPIYRYGARPLDLFRRLIPEILAMRIQKPSLIYHVVGLFNWGKNQDLLANEPLPEEEKEVVVDFQELGFEPQQPVLVFDFWEEKYLGTFTERFGISLAPHFSHIFALQPAENYPQYLSNNRHITQGAIELGNVQWDEGSQTLKGSLRVVEDFDHILFIHVPQNYNLLQIAVDGVDDIKSEADGEVLKVIFRVPSGFQDKEVSWNISFSP